METIREFLKSKDVDVLWERQADVIWIDWRESDEDIIKYCEEKLKTKKLTAQLRKSQNELGYELSISYGEQTQIVPFDPKDVSRDTTLITLNQVLKPDYEIRFWQDSIGSDTLAFIPLSTAHWRALENEFGRAEVQYHFSSIDSDSKVFRLSFDEVGKIIKERNQ